MLLQKTKRSGTRGTRQEVEQIGKLLVHELVFGDQTSQNSASRASSQMFENNSNTDYVQNSIGEVSQGTTVSQIRTQYSELDDLIKSMLKIEQAPATTPTATGISVTWGFSNADVQVGTLYSLTPSIIVDRGDFSPDATSPIPNPPPLGTITSASIIDRQGPGVIYLTPPSSQGITRTFTLTAPTATNLLSTLGEMVYNSASVTFDQGPVVQNNYNTNFGSVSPQTINVTGTRTIRFHAPVYRDGSVNSTSSGSSGQSGTDKMFSTTNYVYITSHQITNVIDVPREPTAWHQYNRLFANAPWTQSILGIEWTKTSISKTIGSSTQSYWRVSWTGIARGVVDIRLSF